MKIKLFGIVQDIIGETEINYPIKKTMSIGELQNVILDKYPKLKDIKKFAFAINETYASTEDLVLDEDVVAIIPPVSGG